MVYVDGSGDAVSKAAELVRDRNMEKLGLKAGNFAERCSREITNLKQ